MGLKFSTVIDTGFRFIYFRFRRFSSGTKWYRKCSMDRPRTRCRKKIRYFIRDFNICNKYTGTSFMDSITGKTRIWNLGEYFDHCKCYSTGSKCFSVSPKLFGYLVGVAMDFVGIAMVGLGSALYITCALGPGPRDGLMTALHHRSGIRVGRVRLGIEATVLILGALLGGTVGLGTALFALFIGQSIAISLGVVSRFTSQ